MAKGWFRRKKGKLVYWWTVLDASTGSAFERSKVVGVASLRDAEGWEEVGRLKARGKIKMDVFATPERITFGELASYYLSHKEWGKESTKNNHTQIVHGRLVPQFGTREAASIRPREIKDWLRTLNVGNTTRSKYKTVMGTIYSFAISEEKIPSVAQMADGTFESSNPASRVKGISGSSEYEAIVLSPLQALKVLQELRQPEYTMVLLVSATGIRQSELLGLHWSDILWERSEIRIRETFVHGNIQRGAKTKLSKSTVVLHPVLLQLLKDWRAESTHASDEDYVFASVKNKGKTPRCGSVVVEDHLRPAAVRAKVIEVRGAKTYVDGELVKRFGFHTFRHSLTSWMMDAGENPQIVRSMLRWTNLNMLAHYAHGFKETKLEAQGRVLAAVLGWNGGRDGSQVQ